MKIMRRIFTGLLLLGCVCALPVSQAFEVSPLVHQLEPVGRAGSSVLIVRNPTDQPLTVEFSAYRMHYSEGKARRSEAADDDLLIFPPAARLSGGDVQAVRIQWVGDPELATARSYFCTIEQLPINAGATSGNGVQVLVTFNAIVHVTPIGATADVQVTQSQLQVDDKGSSLLLQLENRGTANAYGSLIQLVIESDTRHVTLTPADLQDADLFLPPGYRRPLRIELPDEIWHEPVTARIIYGDVP